MNIKRIFSLQLLLCGSFSLHQIQSFVTTSTDLAGNATKTVLHKKSGNFVIGSTATANGDAVLSYAQQATGTLTETLVPTTVTANAAVFITQLALSEQLSDNTNVRAVYVTSDALSTLGVMGINGNGTTQLAAGVKDVNNAPNNGIVALAASSTSIYSAVKVNGGNFAVAGSGIARNLLSDDGVNTIAVGVDGSTQAIVNSIDAIKSNTGTNNPDLTASANTAVLHWCSGLDRLYLGLQGASGGAANDALKALVIFKNDLTIVPLLNDDDAAPLLTGAGAATSNIVGLSGTATTNYSILKLDTMKTSTGHYYLIVQGGLGTNAQDPSKQIFALPLVDADGDVPGSLAAVLQGDGRTNFKLTAVSRNSLLTETSPSAMVGNAQLPVAAGANVISHMVVVGDAVYCSINGANGADTDNGIYYSQAIFNTDGSIAGWTTWAKTVPNQTSGVDSTNGACTSFGVDAITGKIWIPFNATVRVSHWEKPIGTDTLVGSVNTLLEGPCYSQLNLNKFIMNYGNNQAARLAIFGGNNKIVAVATSTAVAVDYNSIDHATADWTVAATRATDISTGLENVGAITALGWTNQDNGVADSYFLAGTNRGLYAFVNTTTGAGIDIAAVTDFTAVPFTGTFSWQQVAALGNDPVVKIISMTGTADPVTFVITQGATHKLWRLSATANATLTALNGTATLVWEAASINNTDDEVTFFYDMALTMDTNGATPSTLVLATDQGLEVANDVTANPVTFTHLDLSNETHEIRSLSTPQGTRVNQHVNYVRSMLRPVADGGWTSAETSALGSVHFTTTPQQQYVLGLRGDSIASGDDTLPLSAAIKNFYSDGGRRFYIEQVQGDSKNGCTLHIAPFYIGSNDYDVTEIFDLADGAIDTPKTFYWVNDMGAGYLCAGTDDGIVALQ